MEEILICSQSLNENVFKYLDSGIWPDCQSDTGKMDAMLLSWYLLWYGIPSFRVIKSAVEKIKAKAPLSLTMIPLLRLLLPTTQAKGIFEIDKFQFWSRVWKSNCTRIWVQMQTLLLAFPAYVNIVSSCYNQFNQVWNAKKKQKGISNVKSDLEPFDLFPSYYFINSYVVLAPYCCIFYDRRTLKDVDNPAAKWVDCPFKRGAWLMWWREECQQNFCSVWA